MSSLRLSVAAVLGLCLMHSVQAMMAYVPLAATVAQSDLVAVGEVVEVVGEAEREFTFPGGTGVSTHYMRTVKMKVTRTLHSPAGVAADQVITVVMLAQKPQKPQEVKGPNGEVMQVMTVVSDGPVYLGLDVGATGGMILRKVAGEDSYYLQGGDGWVRADHAEGMARLTATADVDKWAWGKVENGLQIAIVVDHPVIARPARAQATWQAQVGYVVVVRNTTEAAVNLNTYPNDRFLSVTHQTPDGERAEWPLYQYLDRHNVSNERDPKRHAVTIPAGGMVSLAAHGMSPYGANQMLPTPAAGTHTLSVGYVSQRELKSADGGLWTGELRSAATTFEVKGQE